MTTGEQALRRWPTRNFLEELEPHLRDAQAIEEVAHRSPRLRGLYRRLSRLSEPLRRRLLSRDWVRYSDVRALIQTSEFELAFNLGFENGIVVARAESLRSGRHTVRRPPPRLAADLRAALAILPLQWEPLLPTLLELAWAIARGVPTPAASLGWTTSVTPGTGEKTEEGMAADVAREFSLTKRESQVLRAAVRGLSTKAIAGEIGISGKAVEYYWRRIFAKLGCRAQIEVMALVLRRACRVNRRRRSPSKRNRGHSNVGFSS